jgi:hypothetical protein
VCPGERSEYWNIVNVAMWKALAAPLEESNKLHAEENAEKREKKRARDEARTVEGTQLEGAFTGTRNGLVLTDGLSANLEGVANRKAASNRAKAIRNAELVSKKNAKELKLLTEVRAKLFLGKVPGKAQMAAVVLACRRSRGEDVNSIRVKLKQTGSSGLAATTGEYLRLMADLGPEGLHSVWWALGVPDPSAEVGTAEHDAEIATVLAGESPPAEGEDGEESDNEEEEEEEEDEVEAREDADEEEEDGGEEEDCDEQSAREEDEEEEKQTTSKRPRRRPARFDDDDDDDDDE